MDVKKILGNNVRKYRKKAEFTQEFLAEKLGVSAKHLSKIELGEKFVSAQILEKISETLHVSPAALFLQLESRTENDEFYTQLDKILEENARKLIHSVKEGVGEII